MSNDNKVMYVVAKLWTWADGHICEVYTQGASLKYLKVIELNQSTSPEDYVGDDPVEWYIDKDGQYWRSRMTSIGVLYTMRRAKVPERPTYFDDLPDDLEFDKYAVELLRGLKPFQAEQQAVVEALRRFAALRRYHAKAVHWDQIAMLFGRHDCISRADADRMDSAQYVHDYPGIEKSLIDSHDGIIQQLTMLLGTEGVEQYSVVTVVAPRPDDCKFHHVIPSFVDVIHDSDPDFAQRVLIEHEVTALISAICGFYNLRSVFYNDYEAELKLTTGGVARFFRDEDHRACGVEITTPQLDLPVRLFFME